MKAMSMMMMMMMMMVMVMMVMVMMVMMMVMVMVMICDDDDDDDDDDGDDDGDREAAMTALSMTDLSGTEQALVPFHRQGGIIFVFLLHLLVSAWMSHDLRLNKRAFSCSVVHHVFRIAKTYHVVSNSESPASVKASSGPLGCIAFRLLACPG